MDNNILNEILNQCHCYTRLGKSASYIPELSNVDPKYLGIYVVDMEGKSYFSGDYLQHFTIQSVSKVITFLCSLLDNEINTLLRKVSFEPTSSGFNSIINLETKNENKPLNPMINSGAIATITLVKGLTAEDKFQRILSLVRELASNPEINVDQAVYLSEKITGSRNRALAYYMQSTGIISDLNVEEILDVYFRVCSLNVTCKDLAQIALVLANNGRNLEGQYFFSEEIARTVKAVMTLCGMYDESGEYAVNVGIPSKSGVGGGILATVPGRMGIGVFGPALNKKGTSIAGYKVLEMLSKQLNLSVFG